jgi:hypothetical protein
MMILVECDPDNVLVNMLGIENKEIECARGIGNVSNKLKKRKECKLGLVDEDPDPGKTVPNYFKEFELIEDKDEIKLLYHKEDKKYVIMLCPRLEEWILKVVKLANMDMSNYNLPSNADDLHKITIAMTKFEDYFVNLIKDLKGKSKELKTLENLIKEE